MSMEEYWEIERIRQTNIVFLTEKDFRKLPHREWNEDIGEFDSLIILPAKRDYIGEIKYKLARIVFSLLKRDPPEKCEYIAHLHDSNYYCMDFVAVRDEKPICLLSGCSDVIHIEGIGGYGKDWHGQGGIPIAIGVAGWSIDCLPNSRLLRLFAGYGIKITCDPALSSFSVYSNTAFETRFYRSYEDSDIPYSEIPVLTKGAYEMPDEKIAKDITEVLERGIDPTAAARVADELEVQGKEESAGWVRTHLAEYFAEVLNGVFRKFLKAK